jgi:hypothetical protein
MAVQAEGIRLKQEQRRFEAKKQQMEQDTAKLGDI